MMTHPPRSALTTCRVPVPGWAGRKVRLREIDSADHRTLIGFDRASARERSAQVGGYRHWAAHRAGAAASGDSHFAIETLRGGMLVGSLCLSQDDTESDRFSYGIGIGAQHRRCGYASDAIMVLLSFMFFERSFRRCQVSIYGGNVGSLSLHGALGFREEGRLRDTELSLGDIRYLVLMGITAPEFAARHRDVMLAHADPSPRRGRHWRPRRGRHRHG
ncbi:GNAT family N-acetyltransferase [Prauserella endophytica]